MTNDEFKALIKSMEPKQFVRHELFGESCWVFDDGPVNPKGSYREFRSAIADKVDINPRAVAVVGSAKYGWSMSPTKFGNEFDASKSDIDIVIVSDSLFDSVWDQLLAAYYNGYSDFRKDHRNEIFAKFVVVKSSVDSASTYLRALRLTLLDLNKIVNDFLSLEDRAKYRIYRSWSEAEMYHSKGVAELREAIGEH